MFCHVLCIRLDFVTCRLRLERWQGELAEMLASLPQDQAPVITREVPGGSQKPTLTVVQPSVRWRIGLNRPLKRGQSRIHIVTAASRDEALDKFNAEHHTTMIRIGAHVSSIDPATAEDLTGMEAS